MIKNENTKNCMSQGAIKRACLQEIKGVWLYEVELQKGAAEKEHVHEGPQVTYVVMGSIDLHLEDHVTRMSTGDSILVPGGQAHSASANEDTKLICIR